MIVLGSIGMKILFSIIVFVVSMLVGYKIIKNVPSLLHTPLMSGMNALSGITILGALSVYAFKLNILQEVLVFLALLLATINVVGGFKVTDRMLSMFRKKEDR